MVDCLACSNMSAPVTDAGHGDTNNRASPKTIDILWANGIVQIASGDHHSAALSASGRLYTWGAHQLGILVAACIVCLSSWQLLDCVLDPILSVQEEANMDNWVSAALTTSLAHSMFKPFQ